MKELRPRSVEAGTDYLTEFYNRLVVLSPEVRGYVVLSKIITRSTVDPVTKARIGHELETTRGSFSLEQEEEFKRFHLFERSIQQARVTSLQSFLQKKEKREVVPHGH